MRPVALPASLVAPPRCALRGAACAARAGAWEGCRDQLSRLGAVSAPPVPGLDATWSAAPYRGAARTLVRGLKFGRMLSLARMAAQELAQAPPGLLDGALVPVP